MSSRAEKASIMDLWCKVFLHKVSNFSAQFIASRNYLRPANACDNEWGSADAHEYSTMILFLFYNVTFGFFPCYWGHRNCKSWASCAEKYCCGRIMIDVDKGWPCHHHHLRHLSWACFSYTTEGGRMTGWEDVMRWWCGWWKWECLFK